MQVNLYNPDYYEQFKRHSPVKQWLLQSVDRKEPVFGWLKKTLPKGSRLLDFGCGAGWFMRYAESHFECVGVDSSRAALIKAKTVTKKSNLILGNERVLSELKAHSMDVVCAFDVLEHIHNHQVILKSFKRMLKANAWLVISVPNSGSIMHQILGKRWWAYADSTHMWLENRVFWTNLLSEAGFTTEKKFASGLINHPNSRFALKGVLEGMHYITQSWALWGGPLPDQLNDVIFLVARNKSPII